MADFKYTPADFKSDQEVRWCPGCGDHAILNAVQRALPEIADRTDTPHNLFTFVSGIGCSSRFIYYMKTFGFHSIHGRANAVATGVKVANPRLAVWVTTGDGDSLAIGGNHFIHAIRRNVDLNVVLFNNEIYGLTKGQYSPTSKLGKITKTSPYGTVEKPFNPGELVIGAKGTFFARSVDMEVNLSKECFVAAAMHKGMSVVEVLQNCVIFNDKTHAAYAGDKATRAEHTITLRHGEKMLFGANREKGLVFENMKLKVVTVGQDGYTLDDILTHDAHERDTTLHVMLAAMKYPDYPVALGVIRAVEDDAVYDLAVERQVEEVKAASKIHSVDELLHSGEMDTIKLPYGKDGPGALGAASAQRRLIAAVLRQPEELARIAPALAPESILDEKLREAYQAILACWREGREVSVGALSNEIGEEAMNELCAVAAEYSDVGCTPQDIEMYLERIARGAPLSAQAGRMSGEELADYIARIREKKE